MEIQCLLCDRIKTSMIIGNDIEASKECLFKMNKHYQIKHLSEFNEIQKQGQLFGNMMNSIFVLKRMVNLENEHFPQFLLDDLEKSEKAILEEIMDDEDDEDEEELEEITNEEINKRYDLRNKIDAEFIEEDKKKETLNNPI